MFSDHFLKKEILNFTVFSAERPFHLVHICILLERREKRLNVSLCGKVLSENFKALFARLRERRGMAGLGKAVESRDFPRSLRFK